jgi:hypothetical protein
VAKLAGDSLQRKFFKSMYSYLGLFFIRILYLVQHCSICRPSDSTVSEDAGFEHRTVAVLSVRVSDY